MGEQHSRKRNNEVWRPGDPLTREDLRLLEPVKETAKRLGRTPTKQECSNVRELKQRFRTWKNVILAAGLPDLHSQGQVNIRDNEKGGEYRLKIVVVAVSTSAIAELTRYYEEFQKVYGKNLLELKIYYVANAKVYRKEEKAHIARDIQGADVAVIDLMGSSAPMVEAVNAALDSCKGQRIVIGNICREKIRLGSFDMGSKKREKKTKETRDVVSMMNRMRRMAVAAGTVLPFGITKDMKNMFLLIDYWQQATGEDIASFMNLLLREYFGMNKLPKETPCTMQKGISVKDPQSNRYYDSVKKYSLEKSFDPGKPVVAILFYGHNYPNDVTAVIREAAVQFGKFSNVLPIAFSQNEDKDLDNLKKLLTWDRGVDMIVNFMPFRLGAGPMGGDVKRAVEILREVKVPYLTPFYITKETKEEWEADLAGVNPGEFMISIMLPELDGGTLTIPVGILDHSKIADHSGVAVDEIGVMEERMRRLCGKAEALLRLRSLKNEDKKIAILCYNYPPGEGNLFRASFLDVFGSLENLWRALEEDGYRTEAKSADEIREYFCQEAMYNDSRWSDVSEQMIYYRPEEPQIPPEVEAYWGKWPGDVMADGRGVRIPGMLSGNVFVGVQPARSQGVSDEAQYHSREIPPHHQYLGFYQWIREEFRADAVIHVGTHGTLEFLPGKENGMTDQCYPDKMIGNLPHFYYYYCGNPSEAVTAKRRSGATLVSYAPPAFEPGELYGEFQLLYEMIGEYQESQRLAPERSNTLLRAIQETAAHLDLPVDLQELEQELRRRKESLIPKGLHRLGEGYSSREALDYGAQLMKFWAGGEEKRPWTFFADCLREGKRPSQDVGDAQTKLLDMGRMGMENCQNSQELSGMLRALQGEYIQAEAGGDIYRNPYQFPMGKNIVQFDPRLIPTRTAVERGIQVAENTISRYREQTGNYPRSTAVILWGLETSRSQGETVGQIMAYLGVRLKSTSTSFQSRFELIPTPELRHPRIDVVIHICGFFRDMYSNVIEYLNEIFRQLIQTEESAQINYFAEHSRRMEERLLTEGYSPEDAEELSICRIFGPAQSEYGTTLTDVIRHGQWEREEELAHAFTDSLNCVYTERYQGKNFENLLEMNYATVEIISQIRNNVEYELVDLDHYYEFYGGLSKSVELVRGKKNAMYITDTTQNTVHTEDFQTAMQRGIYTRLLNPKWVEGLLRTPYHGVQKLADRFENVLGMAATTGQIQDKVFQKMEEVYVGDPAMEKRLREDNPQGYLSMIERLMEAHQRGYWTADESQLSQMRRAYLAAERKLER